VTHALFKVVAFYGCVDPINKNCLNGFGVKTAPIVGLKEVFDEDVLLNISQLDCW
jgi:hypothetical protein